MYNWRIKIELSVDESWVADGFDASNRIEDIQDAIASLLPYAYGHEVKVKATIERHPPKENILKAQGY